MAAVTSLSAVTASCTQTDDVSNIFWNLNNSLFWVRLSQKHEWQQDRQLDRVRSGPHHSSGLLHGLLQPGVPGESHIFTLRQFLKELNQTVKWNPVNVVVRWVCSSTVSPWRFTSAELSSSWPAASPSTWGTWRPPTSSSASVSPSGSPTTPTAPSLSARSTAASEPPPSTWTCTPASCSWATSQPTGRTASISALPVPSSKSQSNKYSTFDVFCLQPYINFKNHNSEVTSEDSFEIFSAIIQNLIKKIPEFLCEGANGDANALLILQNSRLC